MVLHAWLPSLGIVFSRFIRVVASGLHPRLQLAAQYPTVCVDGPRFIGLSVDGHFGCFYFLAVTTNATVFTCKFLRGHPFLFLLGIYT